MSQKKSFNEIDRYCLYFYNNDIVHFLFGFVKYVDLDFTEISGKSRIQYICNVRYILCHYLILNAYSIRFIAELLKRDRTTIYHYIKQYEILKEQYTLKSKL